LVIEINVLYIEESFDNFDASMQDCDREGAFSQSLCLPTSLV
jgi:hypothetical protein